MRTAVMAVAVGLIVVQPLLAVGLGLFGWLLPGFKRSSAARVARRRLVALAIAPFALAIVSLLQGDLTTSLHWLAQALLWGAVCLFPPVSRTAVKVGASAGVFFVLSTTTLGALTEATRFTSSGLSFSSGREIVDGQGQRLYRLLGRSSHLSLEAEFEEFEGAPVALNWVSSSGWIERVSTFDEKTMRWVNTFTFPREGVDPFVRVLFDVGEPAGGRTFMVVANLSTPETLPAQGRRGLWLQSWDPHGSNSVAVADLGPDWQTLSTQLTLSESVVSPYLAVVLNDFEGHTVSISNVEIFELKGGSWGKLGGVIRATRANGARLEHWPLDFGGAKALTLDVTTSEKLLSGETVQLTIEPNGGRPISVTKFDVGASERTSVVVPSLSFERIGGWLGHSNIAGHTFLFLTLAWLTRSATVAGGLLATVSGLVVVALTGSRSGTLALLVGLMIVWSARLPRGTRGRFVKVLTVLTVVAVVGVGFLLVTRGAQGVFNEGNRVTRVQIWSFAVESIFHNPWKGNSETGFARAWKNSKYGPVAPVSHAHNALLELGFGHGVFGLIVGMWVAVSLVRLNSGSSAGGAAALMALLMCQLFDNTFWALPVFFSLLLSVEDVPAAGVRYERGATG